MKIKTQSRVETHATSTKSVNVPCILNFAGCLGSKWIHFMLRMCNNYVSKEKVRLFDLRDKNCWMYREFSRYGYCIDEGNGRTMARVEISE